MAEKEHKKYFDGNKKLKFMYTRTFIDFEDMKNPVK